MSSVPVVGLPELLIWALTLAVYAGIVVAVVWLVVWIARASGRR